MTVGWLTRRSEAARIYARLLLVWLALGLVGPAIAQPTAPMLRIETGDHGSWAQDAATDGAGRVLVTASYDKTARVWSLPDLRPLGVLRPTIGEGNEGKLAAVAVSPDGSRAAVGGWTMPTSDQAVLVFDLATYQVVQRLPIVPHTVLALAFSRDGRRLAAGLGSGGIRVWDTTSWQSAFTDPDFAGQVYGLAFSPDGRLAAGSYDGVLRLYAPGGWRLARVPVPNGQLPYRVAFSPDGETLAVGFRNSLAVEVRNGANLALRNQPDIAGLSGENLPRVAWSSDGRSLLAAGGVSVDGRRPIFAWEDGGHGARRIVDPGFDANTTGLQPLPGGGMALMSSRGDLAVLAAASHRTAERTPIGQNLSTASDDTHITRRLLLGGDGAQAAWVAFGKQDHWLRFDAARLDLATSVNPPAGLIDWIDTAGALQVSDWNNSFIPKLNGRPLELKQYERSQSVAALSGQVLLGADWSLRLFDAQGQPRWDPPVPVPGIAWRVNQSGDGRLALAAYDDGTLRWYRLKDGKELLALFVTADAQRWVAWTPSGYYAASPGGEDLIGWQVNRGIDQAADFFPASRFRDRFYRPDVVQRVLATLDETEALHQADAARGSPARPAPDLTQDLPPVVTILSPADGTRLAGPEATLSYSLRSPSGTPVRRVRVLLDGRAAPVSRGLGRTDPADPKGEARGQVAVAVPPGQTVEVSLIADTDTRTSEPARIRLVGAPGAQASHRPTLYALVVGVSDYQAASLHLNYAAKDATEFAALLETQKGGLYRDVQVHLLPDGNQDAIRAAVLDGLEWLRRSATADDVVILFLAGHGANDANGRYWFIPADGSPDPAKLRSTAVAGSEIKDALGGLPSKVVAFVDTCYAGNVAGTFRSADMTQLANELSAAETGLIMFVSSTARELSVELSSVSHGAFTEALLEGARGQADPQHTGAVTVNELGYFIANRVQTLTGGNQHPAPLRPNAIRDFPLFTVPETTHP